MRVAALLVGYGAGMNTGQGILTPSHCAQPTCNLCTTRNKPILIKLLPPHQITLTLTLQKRKTHVTCVTHTEPIPLLQV